MRRCKKCGEVLPSAWDDYCHACDKRTKREKDEDRLDYWLQVMQDSEEGSRTQEIAKRMVTKYRQLLQADRRAGGSGIG